MLYSNPQSTGGELFIRAMAWALTIIGLWTATAHAIAIRGTIQSSEHENKTFILLTNDTERTVEVGPRTFIYRQTPGSPDDFAPDKGAGAIGVLDADRQSVRVRVATLYGDKGRGFEHVRPIGDETEVAGSAVQHEGKPGILSGGEIYELNFTDDSQIRLRIPLNFEELTEGMSVVVYARDIGDERVRQVGSVFVFERRETRPAPAPEPETAEKPLERPVEGRVVGRAESADGKRTYEIFDLGRPFEAQPVRAELATTLEDGSRWAWFVIRDEERHGVAGVCMDSGESQWLDLDEYGRTHIRLHWAENDHLYIFTGSRPAGRFLKYDPLNRELTDIGVPAEDAGNYWLGHAIGPDGIFYVGVFPSTKVVGCDPRTDELIDLGRISEDPEQRYVLNPVVSDDNILYAPTGMVRPELWAYDLDNNTKEQILTPELQEIFIEQDIYMPRNLRLTEEGQIYLLGADVPYLCEPTGLVASDNDDLPPARRVERLLAGNRRAGQLLEQGLSITDHETRESLLIDTDIPPRIVTIFSIGDERDGVLYGGSISPAKVFALDREQNMVKDLGQISTGRIQVYDIHNHPKGLFLSSYTGGHIDLFNPETGESEHVVRLEEHGQERAFKIIDGPDGMLYTGTMPIKGYLDGALARIDPETYETTVWRNIIEDQSFIGVASIPETGEIFCTTTTRGGTGATPKAEEAVVFLWDTEEENIAWQGTPVPGAANYGYSTPIMDNGLIYGVASMEISNTMTHYYVFDPIEREVVRHGELPFTFGHNDVDFNPSGPDGLVFGVSNGTVFALHPEDHAFRVIFSHEALPRHVYYGIRATPDGAVYFSVGSKLMMVDMYPDN